MLLQLISAIAHHQSESSMNLGLQERDLLPATPKVSGTEIEINSADQYRRTTALVQIL